VVDFADLIVPDLRKHLRSVPAGGLAFTSAEGTALSNTNFRRRVWLPALAAVGLEGVHIHDLRHTGNQFIANAGANPRELMARMGHDSPRAALIYMHSSDKRQRTLADAVAKAARAELAKSKKGKAAKPSGTRVACRQVTSQKMRAGERNQIADLRKYGSPVTESNRRPSPYHVPPSGSCSPGRRPDQAIRWLALA
jgi:hypothetical protein